MENYKEQIHSLKEENKTLKSKVTDLNKKIDELSSKINNINDYEINHIKANYIGTILFLILILFIKDMDVIDLKIIQVSQLTFMIGAAIFISLFFIKETTAYTKAFYKKFFHK